MNRSGMTVVISALFILGVLMFLMPKYIDAGDQGETEVGFRWAFGAMVGPENDRELISIKKDTVLHAGDQIKIFLELQKKCFVYLFYYSSQGELIMLFPSDLAASNDTPRSQFFIPPGTLWFELDEVTGLETFYLIASAQRLDQLEALYRTHAALTRDNDLKESAQNILAEIKKIRRQHQTLTADAERPVRLGGNVRGTTKDRITSSPDIAHIAVEIAAPNFYSRTFTIDHQ